MYVARLQYILFRKVNVYLYRLRKTVRVTKTKHFFIIPDFLSPIWCTNNIAGAELHTSHSTAVVLFFIVRVG